jgi:hypothetical protein
MDQASLHALLLSQSEETFQRGLRYFNLAEGWEEWPVDGDFKYYSLITEDDYVSRYHAKFNKTPLQAIQYLRDNRVNVFTRHSPIFVSTTFHNRFEDHSFLAEDFFRTPELGDFAIWKYVRVKRDGDTYWLVGTSPNGDAWPKAALWHDFELIKFEPTEGGCNVTCYSRGEMQYALSMELKRAYVPTWQKYYFGIADEVNAATV